MFLLKKLKPKSQSHTPVTPKPQQQQQPLPICPWSARRLNILSNASLSQFRQSGYALTAIATAAGELFLFGGIEPNSDSAHNDLYVFSSRDLSVTLLQTSGDVPSLRYGQAGALVGDDILIWGGATNTDDQGGIRKKGPHDDALYLLNLESRKWTRVVVNGPSPEGRYYHAMTIVGSKLFVFGGQVDGKYLNDMWAIDLNSLKSNPVWDSYESTPGDEKPPLMASHVFVTIGDRLILFGGADSRTVYRRTWSFDVSTRKWTTLNCTGRIPSHREGHAAAIVDDVMYIFGGRGANDTHLDDLIAFKLSTQQWIRFRNTGPSPSRRWRHAMASDGSRVLVVGGGGGGPSATAQGDETALIYVFDTKHIKYPNPNPNATEPSKETTPLSRKSSSIPPTQEQPQHPTSPTSSSADAYVAHGASPFQEATPEELGRVTLPQITPERNPSPNALPLQPTEFAVPEASSDGEVAQLEPEWRLSAGLASRTERDRRLAQLTDELALKSALLEQAEATAEAAKRAGMEHADRADRLLAQVQQKNAELVDMQAKLDELLLSRNQLVRALEQAQSTSQKATPRAADADERSQRAGEQTGQYETELAELRAKLEARESELEAVRLRLADAENGWTKGKTETDDKVGLRTMTTDEGQITRGLMERLRSMEAEMASLRLSEKSLEAFQSRNEG